MCSLYPLLNLTLASPCWLEVVVGFELMDKQCQLQKQTLRGAIGQGRPARAGPVTAPISDSDSAVSKERGDRFQ